MSLTHTKLQFMTILSYLIIYRIDPNIIYYNLANVYLNQIKNLLTNIIDFNQIREREGEH